MDYHDLVAEYGSLSQAAKNIGVTKQAVCNWKTRGVPESQQVEIHRKTKGRLRADPRIITKYREVLRSA